MPSLLQVRNLSVSFQTSRGTFCAVEDFDFTLEKGEILTLVGESGSGKSVAMLAIMDLLGEDVIVKADEISFEGKNLLTMSKKMRQKLYGESLSMIFQEPFNSLNPCFKVGDQVAEMFTTHKGFSKKKAKDKVLELFHQVGIAETEIRYNLYPHQLSGGMNQRVMIAIAIALNPKLLIADEPTTALDVTIQAQILQLLMEICQNKGMALVLITHNIGIVAELAETVIVQYAGMQMEKSPCLDLLNRPLHPYTKALLEANPENSQAKRLFSIPGAIPLLEEKPKGCYFAPRCGYKTANCLNPIPIVKVGKTETRCLHYDQLLPKF